MCTKNGSTEENNDEGIISNKDKSRSPSSAKGGRAANGDRVRDGNGYRQRAAAFCARLFTAEEIASELGGGDGTRHNVVKPRLEVLMVSGRREGSCENYWVLPGGGVESMESTEQAVVRELREEAGILGKVLFLIGKFIDEQRFHHTTLYFLTVQETFDEWENCQNGRERRWMDMEQARKSIKQNQLAMLEQSIEVIEQTLAVNSGNGSLNCSLLAKISPAKDGDSDCRASCPPSPPNNNTSLEQQKMLLTAAVKSPPFGSSMAKSASLD